MKHRNRLIAGAVLAVLACAGPAGPKGDQGDPGAQGAQGAKGDPGPPGTFSGVFDGGVAFAGDVTITGGLSVTGPVSASIFPPGMVSAFAGTTAPAGWLLCDGAAVSRTQYSALFAAIGIAHGGGDGINTFNLPDYRGRFLRGQDRGVARDPDRASRTSMAGGGATGDNIGSLEADSNRSHSHGVSDPGHSHSQYVTANPGSCPGSGIIRSDYNNDVTDACPYAQGWGTGSASTGIAINASGGSESRPANAYVNFIIKY